MFVECKYFTQRIHTTIREKLNMKESKAIQNTFVVAFEYVKKKLGWEPNKALLQVVRVNRELLCSRFNEPSIYYMKFIFYFPLNSKHHVYGVLIFFVHSCQTIYYLMCCDCYVMVNDNMLYRSWWDNLAQMYGCKNSTGVSSDSEAS